MSVWVTKNHSLTLWENKPFLYILFSSFLLSIANKIYEIVLPMLMYELTHSSIAMTTMRTAELLPNFFFGIFIGVIVDRVNKKQWVGWMVGLQAILLFILVWLLKQEWEIMILYYGIGFFLMTFNYGYFNAQVSLTKQIVPNHNMTSANAKFSFIETFVGLMGPAFTGGILLLSSLNDGILITAILYSVCFILLLLLPNHHEQDQANPQSFKKDFLEGWEAFRSNRSLWMMTLFVIVLNCSFIVTSTTIIFFAKDDLNLSSSLLAIVLSTGGVSGLLGSLVINQMRMKWGLGKVFGISILLNALGYLTLTFSHSVLGLGMGLFITGFAGTLYSVCVYTFRLEQTPSHLMGRISGITGTLFRVGMPVVMTLSGWIILWWGTSSVFLSSFIVNLVVFIIFVRTHLVEVS